jgi:crotonobetainyl-CoA:carnitine CoA-transferase CaiB-like acyl-CoA transferase
MADGPLSGIPIVDFTENMAEPFDTVILADQGADVGKVESQALRNWLVRASLPVLPFSNQPGRR